MNDNSDTDVANVIWKNDADMALIGGFTTSVLCIFLMITQMMSGNWTGLFGIIGAAAAFPLFFYFKNLKQSKLFVLRCIRIVIGLVIMGILLLIG